MENISLVFSNLNRIELISGRRSLISNCFVHSSILTYIFFNIDQVHSSILTYIFVNVDQVHSSIFKKPLCRIQATWHRCSMSGANLSLLLSVHISCWKIKWFTRENHFSLVPMKHLSPFLSKICLYPWSREPFFSFFVYLGEWWNSFHCRKCLTAKNNRI